MTHPPPTAATPAPPAPRRSARLDPAVAIVACWAVALVASGLRPHDRVTWALEVAPVVVVAPILVLTRRRFPLTPLLHVLVLLHGLLLLHAAHSTYAHVPLGEIAREAVGLARNPFDRLGHLAQGFVPAIALREVLLRLGVMRPGRALFVRVAAACLALSAAWEILEWGVVVARGEDPAVYTQGDPFDAQADMLLALVGAVAAQLLLGRWHDRQVGRLGPPGRPGRLGPGRPWASGPELTGRPPAPRP